MKTLQERVNESINESISDDIVKIKAEISRLNKEEMETVEGGGIINPQDPLAIKRNKLVKKLKKLEKSRK